MAKLITPFQMVTWSGMEKHSWINRKENTSIAILSDSFMEDTKLGLKLMIQLTSKSTEALRPNQKANLLQRLNKPKLINFKPNSRESGKKETNSYQKYKNKLKTPQKTIMELNWLIATNHYKNTCQQEFSKV